MFAATKLLLTRRLAAPTSPFVTRDPSTGYLMFNGTRYRFAGNNGEMAGLSESSTTYGEPVDPVTSLHVMNHNAVDAYIAAAVAMKARVVRVFLSGIGVAGTFMPTLDTYDHSALDGMDYAITQCAANGIKIIAALSDDYDYYIHGKYTWCTLNGITPDGNAHEFFTNPTVVASFKAFVSALLNHTNAYTSVKYKDDNVFLAFETGNELTDATSPQALLDWTADLAQYLKLTIGIKQLVMDGKWSILGSSTTLSQTHMNNPYIDIFTEHTYDSGRTPAHMANQATICHNYGKAFVIGEYGMTSLTPGGSGISWTNADMIAAVEGNANIDGGLFWNLLALGMTHGGPGQYASHVPGDDPTMVSRITAQKNHAIAMASGLTAGPKKAATLIGPDTDMSKWNARSTATVTSGQIVLPTGDTAFSSAVPYDLSNSSVAVELVQKNPGTGASLCGFIIQPTPAPYASNTVGFIIAGNTMNFRQDVGGNSDVPEAYSSVNHRWLRMRASADATVLTDYPVSLGSLYLETSADGVTWTVKRTLSTPLVLTSVYVVLLNWNYGGDGTSGAAIFDNVNHTP